MDIIVTRYIGIRGTAALAKRFRGELLKMLPERIVEEAESFDEDLKELPELRIAKDRGAFYVKEYLEGGILEALYRMSRECKCGLEAEILRIPVKQETIEVCEVLRANPYALYSGYSALILCEDPEEMIRILDENDIPAVRIGHTMPGNDKILINGDERGYLPHIRIDELDRLISETGEKEAQ